MRSSTLFDALQNLIGRKPTQQEIADVLGVKQGVIGNRAMRNSNYPDEEVDIIQQHYGINLVSMSSDDCFSIPVLGDVEASCGFGVVVNNECKTGSYAIGRKLAKDLGISTTESNIIFAKGDSMAPTIEGGDGLLVDTSKKEVYDGSIYCVRIEGQLYAKRLQKIPPKTVVVVSDNPKYKSFEVDFSKEIDFDFEVIGEVRWSGRVFR